MYLKRKEKKEKGNKTYMHCECSEGVHEVNNGSAEKMNREKSRKREGFLAFAR